MPHNIWHGVCFPLCVGKEDLQSLHHLGSEWPRDEGLLSRKLPIYYQHEKIRILSTLLSPFRFLSLVKSDNSNWMASPPDLAHCGPPPYPPSFYTTMKPIFKINVKQVRKCLLWQKSTKLYVNLLENCKKYPFWVMRASLLGWMNRGTNEGARSKSKMSS